MLYSNAHMFDHIHPVPATWKFALCIWKRRGSHGGGQVWVGRLSMAYWSSLLASSWPAWSVPPFSLGVAGWLL